MHRSGSSLFTGLLEQAGFSVGDDNDLVATRPDNPKGYFERKDIVRLNDQILSDAGGNTIDVPPELSSFDISDQRRTELVQVVESLNGQGVQLIKDPRLCLTLQWWLEFFPEAKIVYLYRHPQEVAYSLQRRQNIPLNVGRALWEYYNIYALNQSRGRPTYFVGLDDFIQQPEMTFDSLLGWLAGEKKNEICLTQEQLHDFFDIELLRSRLKLENDDDLNPLQLTLLKVLRDASNDETYKLSSETARTLSAWHEVIGLGFDVAKGRFIDEQCAQENRDLRRRNYELARSKEGLLKQVGNLQEKRQQLSANKDALKAQKWELKKKAVRQQNLVNNFLKTKNGKVAGWVDSLSSVYRKDGNAKSLYQQLREAAQEPID